MHSTQVQQIIIRGCGWLWYLSVAEAFAHLGDVRQKDQIGPLVPLNECVGKWLPDPWPLEVVY